MEKNIAEATSAKRPEKPYAFIFGHAFWNSCSPKDTLAWIDQVQDALGKVRPYLRLGRYLTYPRLYIGPSAAGPAKPEAFLETQGNEAVPIFQAAVRQPILDRGIEVMSVFNMSINATIPDGTHPGARINLLKAMTIINWLSMVDTRAWNDKLPPNPPASIAPSLPRPDYSWINRTATAKEDTST